MSEQYIFHVNTSIPVGGKHDDGGRQLRVHFPFATTEVESVQAFHERLHTRKSVFGHRLVTRPDGSGGFFIVGMVATMLTLDGIAMIQDWTRGPLIEKE